MCVLVDKVMESCFQLISLFYFTIGRNHEAPATYALTSTIKRLLDHLTEVDIYSEKDLESIRDTLERLSGSIDQAFEKGDTVGQHAPYLLTLVRNRVQLCREMTDTLQKRLDRFSACLLTKHEKLISILRSISLANTKSKVCWLVNLSCPRIANEERYSSLRMRYRSYRSSSSNLENRRKTASLSRQMEPRRQGVRRFRTCTTDVSNGPNWCLRGKLVREATSMESI